MCSTLWPSLSKGQRHDHARRSCRCSATSGVRRGHGDSCGERLSSIYHDKGVYVCSVMKRTSMKCSPEFATR